MKIATPILLKCMLCLAIVFSTYFSSHAQPSGFTKELGEISLQQQIRVEEVIRFEVLKITQDKSPQVILQLTTKEDFKIYEDKLHFTFYAENQFPYELKYLSDKKPELYDDPFFKSEKKIFKNNTQFTLTIDRPLTISDQIEIDVQACSHAVCLIPAKLTVQIKEGGKTKLVNNSALNFQNLSNETSLLKSKEQLTSPIETTATPTNVTDNMTLLNDNLAVQIQTAIQAGSWLLFPALLLAGLLMNLTPCVYPMIPITLNVMSQFAPNKDKRNKGFLPIVYVAGMILTYSLLGVFAALSGTIFGAQLGNPIFNVIIAGIMFLLGLSMLGVFNLSKLQSVGNKIPLTKNYPKVAVLTMGAVSGLISAPCTGPVLSTILILIAQNKNPIVGFTYMFFFALGFGLPYIALGYFGQGLNRVPKFPRVVNFIKIFFAALMFALALYYLRFYLQKVPYAQELYLKPSFLTVSILILSACIFTYITIKPKLLGFLAKIGLLFTTTLVGLWVTLYTTNSFQLKRESNFITKSNTQSKIKWLTDFSTAVELAQKNNKPILIDVWADWCAACLEMEGTSWQDEKLAEYLERNFIVVKLDYTDLPDDIQTLVTRWQINGLPAIAYFKANSDFAGKPTVLLQGYASAGKLLSTAMNIAQ